MEESGPRGPTPVIDTVEVEPGIWSVIDGTRVYEVRIAGEHVLVNGLKSPRAGKITKIATEQHATVDAGAVLLTIE